MERDGMKSPLCGCSIPKDQPFHLFLKSLHYCWNYLLHRKWKPKLEFTDLVLSPCSIKMEAQGQRMPWEM